MEVFILGCVKQCAALKLLWGNYHDFYLVNREIVMACTAPPNWRKFVVNSQDNL